MYDIALTLDDEVRLVWKSPWGATKALFLFVRYFTPLSSILSVVAPLQTRLSLEDSCLMSFAFLSLSLTLTHAAADLLLIIRVFAIWDRSKGVMCILLPLAAAAYAVQTAANAHYYVLIKANKPGSMFCFTWHATDVMYAGWSLAIVLDITAFVLTLIMALRHWRARQINTPLLSIFYRDGLFYYLVIPLLQIFRLAGSAAGTVYTITFGTSAVRSFTAILVTRMFLNLRAVRTHEDWAAATSIQFDHRPSPGRGEESDVRVKIERGAGAEVSSSEMELSTFDGGTSRWESTYDPYDV
ncbi:hypothetical protein BOTBODRAFT_28345 [Botryobasidium botryosum FD-172 SS1]|uniref:DUF6533 domain-containing protein n=1 Tax=Botryobasidium botryosum (strain FD-172 SS1) TaxID=930990 RepID=A0A067MT15_BOTB1|nr:hypothetical protein BOTBODRAFT_28345 [Botryobasidium botryosum FD-172 SS1]